MRSYALLSIGISAALCAWLAGACGSSDETSGAGGSATTTATGTGGAQGGSGGGAQGGSGGAGGERACRFAYLDTVGLPDFWKMLVDGTGCDGNCAANVRNDPLVVASTAGNRRVVFPAGWAISEAEMDAQGKFTPNTGNSAILVAQSANAGLWHVFGDHGGGTCQSILQRLSLSERGAYGISTLYGHDSGAFLFRLGSAALSPPQHFSDCPMDHFHGSAVSNVSLLFAAAVVGDSTCSQCPNTSPTLVPPDGVLCSGYHADLLWDLIIHQSCFGVPQNHFMSSSSGHELLVAGAGNLVVADLDAQSSMNGFGPLVPMTQVALDLAGNATLAPASGQVTCPAGNLRASVLLGPARDDHVFFVSATDGTTTSPVVALDLGPDGTTVEPSGPLAGFPPTSPPPLGPGAATLVGPWMVGGKRLALRVVGIPSSLEALEVWDMETTGVAKVADVPIVPPSDSLVQVVETSSGVFALLAHWNNDSGSPVQELRVLSLGALAAGGSGDRPILDGPIAGGVESASCPPDCYLPSGASTQAFAEDERVHLASSTFNLAYVCDP